MKKVCCVLFLSFAVFLSGITVAYYNTASFGYDNANILSYNDEYIRVFDYTIEYKRINYIKKRLQSAVPPQWIAI